MSEKMTRTQIKNLERLGGVNPADQPFSRRQFIAQVGGYGLVAGGAVGVVLSYWLVQVLVRLNPRFLPRVSEIRVDGSVLLFGLGVSLAALLLTITGASSVSASSACTVTVSPHSGVAGTVSLSRADSICRTAAVLNGASGSITANPWAARSCAEVTASTGHGLAVAINATGREANRRQIRWITVSESGSDQ